MIAIGDRVCYRNRPSMQGTVIAIREHWRRIARSIWLGIPREIGVRWDPQFGIIPGPVFESELFLILVSDVQTETEAT